MSVTALDRTAAREELQRAADALLACLAALGADTATMTAPAGLVFVALSPMSELVAEDLRATVSAAAVEALALATLRGES